MRHPKVAALAATCHHGSLEKSSVSLWTVASVLHAPALADIHVSAMRKLKRGWARVLTGFRLGPGILGLGMVPWAKGPSYARPKRLGPKGSGFRFYWALGLKLKIKINKLKVFGLGLNRTRV